MSAESKRDREGSFRPWSARRQPRACGSAALHSQGSTMLPCECIPLIGGPCSHIINNPGPQGLRRGRRPVDVRGEMERRLEGPAALVLGSHGSDRGRAGWQHRNCLVSASHCYGHCSHILNNSEPRGSAVSVAAAANFGCRRGAAGDICVACASLRAPMSAGLSVGLPMGWLWKCQGCCLVLHVLAPGGMRSSRGALLPWAERF